MLLRSLIGSEEDRGHYGKSGSEAAHSHLRSFCLRFDPLESRSMVGHFFAVHDGFASRGNCVRIIKSDGQRVHVRFFRWIDAAGFVQVETDGAVIRGFEEHAGPVTHDAIMGERQFAALVEIHGDHFVGRAGKDAFFEDCAPRQKPILHGKVDWPLADIGLALPCADQALHPFELRRACFGSWGFGCAQQ